jgi:uncharacterized protein (UPF0548 family)
MFFAREPSDEAVRQFLESQRTAPFTYPDVGASARTPPSGFFVDHNRVQLGHGPDVYERAVSGLRRWCQFDLGWVRVANDDAPIEVGSVVAIKARAFGSWSLNACRIVYVIDEDGATKKFGFGYGTLPDHIERGEERFTIEWHKEDDSVWYDILAFSQPHHPVVWLGLPFARIFQKRFARESKVRMVREVANIPEGNQDRGCQSTH